MNKFTVSIKRDGAWQPINATPVFPFSWGELLDERLDEAYITVYDSPEQTYKRLTDVKVSIRNKTDAGDKTKDEYFIIASDNSYELPVGSGKYKHDIYLIERTKLLEGIYCSSITFTNSKGNIFSSNTGYATPVDISGSYKAASSFPDGFVPSFKAVTPIGNITLPSAQELATEMLPLVKNTVSEGCEVWDGAVFDDYIPQVVYYTSAIIITSDTSTNYGYTAPISFNAEGAFVAQYTLCYKYTASLQTLYKAYVIQFDLAAVTNNLPLKRWSITDCVTRACELAEPLFAGETPKYRLDGVVYENGKATYTEGSLAEKYNKVFAPEFTATEDTLREQLKLIFSYVHAEPWLDENGVIRVTDYGNTAKSPSAALPYVYNAVSSHINEYCTEVRSHAQNLVSSLGYAKGVMIDPGNGLYRSIRSDTAYVRINENNGIAITSAPIYSIEKVMCGIAKTDGTGWRLAPVDITPYVFEETEYSANLTSYDGGYPTSKKYAIYYTQGAPNLKGLFYKAPNALDAANFSPFAISNILYQVSYIKASDIDKLLTDEVGAAASLVFSISYKPISNHFVSHGKQLYVAGETPYMQLYNQSENLVESQYYGENLRGVAARLGNIEKERTFILRDIDDVPRVGDMLDGYAISAVSCELYPFDIKCTVGLTKDFNRISEYVGINSQKRMYEVSERSAVDRDILIKETLVISEKRLQDSEYSSENYIWGDLNPFYNILKPGATNSGYRISTATFTGRNRAKKLVGSPVCLPVIARALGNVVTLNFSMKDNYSAGAKTQFVTGTGADAGEITGRWENDVPYSDYYGRVWFSEIWFQRGNVAGNASAEALAKFAYSTPDIAGTKISAFGWGDIRVYNHILRKDNRERISYNIELDIKTDKEDLIVGSSLAELCGWVNDSTPGITVRYFDTNVHTVGKFDRLYTPDASDTIVPDFSASNAVNVTKNSNGSLTLTIDPVVSGRGWAICTPITTETVDVEDEYGEKVPQTYQTGGEILLASNTPLTAPLNLDFYVVKK